MRVVGVGDNVVDLYPNGERRAGGCVVNVLQALSQAGHSCSYVGVMGSDEKGVFMSESLTHMDLSHAQVKEGANAWCRISFLDGNPVYQGERGVSRPLHLTESDLCFIQSHDLIYTGVDAAIDHYLPLLATKDLAYDFSWRWHGVEALLPLLTYAFFSGADKEGVSELMGVLKAWGGIGVITLGGRGSWGVSPSGECWVKTKVLPAVHPVGAGDAYIAGFLHSYQGDLQEAMESGTKWACRYLLSNT